MALQYRMMCGDHVSNTLAAWVAAWPSAAWTQLSRHAGLVFDPYKAYGGAITGAEQLSYVDIIIDPLLAALNEALTQDTKVRAAGAGPASCKLE